MHLTLLDKIIRVLVLEYGADRVRNAIERSSIQSPDVERSVLNTPSRKKPNAKQQLEIAAIADEKKLILTELAHRFDKRLFMPSNSDVREFLILLGVRPPGMKDRSDAFRQLLKSLSDLPTSQLEALAKKARYAGPSELSSLSDAISTAAGQITRNKGS